MADLVFTITQGAKYQDRIIRIPGDFSLWIPQGQIRSNYGATDWVIDWDFYPLTYDAVTGKTTVTPYLGATKTSLLPVPSQKVKSAYNPGQNVWVTDFELHNPNDSEDVFKVLSQVYIQVIPEVTLDA